jgi:hypothetical protein
MNSATSGASDEAALATAEAAAAVGVAAGQLGYQLTTKALQESSAAAVFPLLLLEFTAIAGGFAAYAATEAAARLADANAQASATRGAAYWGDAP